MEQFLNTISTHTRALNLSNRFYQLPHELTNKENNDIDVYENGSKHEAISHIQSVNNCKQNVRPSPVINQYPEK